VTWRPITLALLALAFAAPAQAQTSLSPVGLWTFTTAATDKGCALSGEMVVMAGKDKRFACTFKVVETCTERLPRAIHTEQSCTIIQTDANVAVNSKVEKVVSVDPITMMEEEVAGYLPDNFKLTITAHGDTMTGAYSSHRTAVAVFRRKQELVS
jgi:hypothetical protein